MIVCSLRVFPPEERRKGFTCEQSRELEREDFSPSVQCGRAGSWVGLHK